MNKINFSGETFNKNMYYYPLMVFASVYQVRQKPEFGFSSTVALGREMSAGETSFCRETCLFPGGLHASSSSTATELKS